ncbi:MAG: hypothetical protein ABIX01_08460 [Chitinophagaceae bacterium]
MTSIICTLFESHYHYGLAALTNSLSHYGFSGSIFAGYRGVLPGWANIAKEDASLEWPGGTTMVVSPAIKLHFLPLDTDYHLTNYKPDFMQRLWKGPARDAGGMYYLDPDIVTSVRWSFFEEWSSSGIALCEDVNSPLPLHHPRRLAWRKYFKNTNISLQARETIYANGGFVGLTKDNSDFLELWKKVQEAMAPEIGGLNCSSLAGTPLPESARGPYAPFGKTDQDALNIAVEAWEGRVNFVGKEGMAFIQGAPMLPHALGAPKPWHQKPISQALNGRPPRRVDSDYWKFANGSVNAQKPGLVKRRKLALKVASFISRFYYRK